MKKKERQIFSNNHMRTEQYLENRYVPSMRKLISAEIKKFIADLRNHGERTAVANLNKVVWNDKITKLLEKMHKEAIPRFARMQYRLAKRLTIEVKKESAAFGFSAQWNFALIDWLSQHLLDNVVIPITETTKKRIMDVLEEGQANGWGIERIVTELEKVDQLSAMRARRIIRTELGFGANFATNLAASEIEFETQEEWITAQDHRVRDSHRKMDGVIIETGAMFQVPIYKGKKDTGAIDLMTGPGDPKASAGNVINCRCTRAIIPKRDENGQLIDKPKRLIHN
jgi:hypothetical protein